MFYTFIRLMLLQRILKQFSKSKFINARGSKLKSIMLYGAEFLLTFILKPGKKKSPNAFKSKSRGKAR